MKEILDEMQATLAELKTQVGRDMPQFDRLEANIKALRQPEGHFIASPEGGGLPASFPGSAALATAGISTWAQLRNEMAQHGPTLPHLSAAIDEPTRLAIRDAAQREGSTASTAAPTTAIPAESPESPFARVLGKQKEG